MRHRIKMPGLSGLLRRLMETSQLLSAIDEEISRLTHARALLAGSNGTTRGKSKAPRAIKTAAVKRVLSPDARKRIADAQRRRWAAEKKASK
jgi:hypothetical protein